MKLTTLIEMMENPEYQSLSCGEFAHIVRRSGVLEEDEDELAFLTDPDWKPTSVIYNGEKREL